MPELAEVEFYRRKWEAGIGEEIVEVNVHPKARIFRETPATVFRKHLPGERLEAGFTHGKQWLFQFSGGKWLGGHLGMTGKLFVADRDYEPVKADHLVLRGRERTLVFADSRMFGKVTLDVVDDGAPPEWWRNLPPSVLDKGFTKGYVGKFLDRHPKTPVKTLLLDQRCFPGIGNWMADEICWRMPVFPGKRVGELTIDERSSLWKETRQVSRQALRVIAPDWEKPPNSWLFNHRWKDGGFCPRKSCRGVELLRGDLRGRTTCWCPVCQKEG